MKTVQTSVFAFVFLPFFINAFEVLTWDTFKSRYNKNYEVDEDADRETIFEQTLVDLTAIEADISANSLGYTVSLNQYSDWTSEELRSNAFVMQY